MNKISQFIDELESKCPSVMVNRTSVTTWTISTSGYQTAEFYDADALRAKHGFTYKGSDFDKMSGRTFLRLASVECSACVAFKGDEENWTCPKCGINVPF